MEASAAAKWEFFNLFPFAVYLFHYEYSLNGYCLIWIGTKKFAFLQLYTLLLQVGDTGEVFPVSEK